MSKRTIKQSGSASAPTRTRKPKWNYQWLALGRECLIRGGASPSLADSCIDEITGDFRDLDNDLKQAAFDHAASIGCSGPGWEEPDPSAYFRSVPKEG